MPYLKSYGIEPEDFLPASCRRALATGEDITLNPSQYLDFLRTIDTTIPDKELLKLGTQSSLKQWVPAIFGALAADNGWEGLARFERYKKLTAPIDMHTTHEKNRCRVEFAFAGAERALPRSGVLLEQVILLTLMRTGTGRHIVPLFVEAPFEYSAEYTEFFGVAPRAASCNSLVFAAADLLLPFRKANNVMWEYLEPVLDEKIAASQHHYGVVQSVRAELLQMIPSGSYSLEKLSSHLGVSGRTLQRELQQAGTSYQHECSQAQSELACSYLKNPVASLQDVALLSGYTEVSSFTRAFKKWTGLTPGQYRNQLPSHDNTADTVNDS